MMGPPLHRVICPVPPRATLLHAQRRQLEQRWAVQPAALPSVHVEQTGATERERQRLGRPGMTAETQPGLWH